MSIPYLYDVATCADDVDSVAWRKVCDRHGHQFLDLPYLRAVERSFTGDTRISYVIFRNDAGEPIACTCFSSYLVDGALMAAPWFQKLAAGIRRVRGKFLKLKVLLCGVPVSTCAHQLAIVDNVDMARLIPALDALAVKLAKEAGCALISFKEFTHDEAARMSGLAELGFDPAHSVFAYSLPAEFRSFEDYLSQRSQRNRANMRRSMRKFDAAGYTCEQLCGRDGIEQLFTDDVYRLYLNVFNKAKLRFEKIPLEFFRELAREYPDESRFTIARKAGRIVGFVCSLLSRGAHSILWVGLDYTLNTEVELYFNLIYRALSQGTVPEVHVIHIGATADEFKQRLGFTGQSLSIYVKGVGPVWQFLFKKFFWMLFETIKVPAPQPVLAVPQPDRIAA